MLLCNSGDGSFYIFLEVFVTYGEGSPVQTLDELHSSQLVKSVSEENEVQKATRAYQGREVVACFPTELVLVPESKNILHIGDKMLRICLEDDVDEQRHERVGRRVGL